MIMMMGEEHNGKASVTDLRPMSIRGGVQSKVKEEKERGVGPK
jgi:hypothetical protein